MTAILKSLPRRSLAQNSPPLHALSGLQARLKGPELWIYRDDLNGFGFGGNKVGKLELLLADATSKNATCLVTLGAAQSNHARVTAVAARVAGLPAYLILGGSPPQRLSGNLVLDALAGAHVVYAETSDWNELRARMESVVEDLRRRGERPYPIPLGGSTAIGVSAASYAVMAMLDQMEGPPSRIVLASGSGGTQAGLEVGLRALSVETRVSGIAVTSLNLPETIAELANQTASLLGVDHRWASSDLEVNTNYLGRGYAEITEASEEAIKLLVETDGIFLDHVYTGKAMAGLIGEVQRGAFARSERIVFWHTGGAPQLFALTAPTLVPSVAV